MPTLFARCEESGRPILANQAPCGKWLKCWFCDVLVRRRDVIGKVPHYITRRGMEHGHPVCGTHAESTKTLNTENAVNIFIQAMARESEATGGEGGGSNPPDNEEKEVYLKNLADLVSYGLILCPDFDLNSKDRLSDILINPEIAPDYFAGSPKVNLGFRAFVVKLDTFIDEKKMIRYVMDYRSQDGSAKKMYFYQTTTAESIYSNLKCKLFAESKDGKGYIARNYPAVLIYGAWIANECSWCKRKDKNPGCLREEGCLGYRYESSVTKEKYVYPIRQKQMG